MNPWAEWALLLAAWLAAVGALTVGAGWRRMRWVLLAAFAAALLWNDGVTIWRLVLGYGTATVAVGAYLKLRPAASEVAPAEVSA